MPQPEPAAVPGDLFDCTHPASPCEGERRGFVESHILATNLLLLLPQGPGGRRHKMIFYLHSWPILVSFGCPPGTADRGTYRAWALLRGVPRPLARIWEPSGFFAAFTCGDQY